MPEDKPTLISAEFPFDSRFLEVEGSRLHYVEQGSGDPILFLHGNPTWSYLWRNVLPHLSPHARAMALDLIGMGRSDKPDIDYRFLDHVRYVEGFIQGLQLKNLTLVLHDWGAALGFHYAMHHPDRVKAIAFMEPAGLWVVPSWDFYSEAKRKLFRSYRDPDLGWDLLVNQNDFVENHLPDGVIRSLTQEEMDRYREPFRDPTSRKPIWRWPNEIPIENQPEDVTRAVNEYNALLQKSEIPKLLLHASPGRIVTPSVLAWCQTHLPKLQTVHIGEGLHFLAEDHPHRIGSELSNWYRSLGTPPAGKMPASTPSA